MIRPDLSKWEYKQELEGLLVFAQALEEMLFHHTIDTYKAPALNVRTNVLELRSLASRLRSNRIKLGTIQPVIDELEYRLKQEVVCQELCKISSGLVSIAGAEMFLKLRLRTTA